MKGGRPNTDLREMGISDFRFLFQRDGSNRSRKAASGAHRRGHTRHVIEGLQSTLGAVIDLSQSGMRVWTTREPRVSAGTCIPLVLADGDQRMDVLATVMWARRVEDGAGWQLGLRFEQDDPVRRLAIETYVKAGYFTTDPAVRRELHEHDESFEQPEAAPAPRLQAEVVDLYKLLDVAPKATMDEIHVAYRKLARSCHPDQNDGNDAAERFMRLSKAYAVLKDAESRAKYDDVVRRLAA